MPDKAHKIRLLNDRLRKDGRGGRIMVTGSLCQADIEEQTVVIGLTRAFDAFTEDNDPYGEHDFGIVRWQAPDGERVYNWKIDYYDLSEQYASPDAADPVRTVRIMSIFYAEDY